MSPKLHRILFLDDDVVVQKDLTGLWEIDMEGKVNGAVETCFGSFHRYDKYMNFSHPLILELDMNWLRLSPIVGAIRQKHINKKSGQLMKFWNHGLFPSCTHLRT